MNVDGMQVKVAVLKAACGIMALDELQLLRRLEELYLEGAKWGADLMHQKSVEVLSNGKANGPTSGESQDGR